METKPSGLPRLIGILFLVVGVIALCVGVAWLTATEKWPGNMHSLGGLSFYLWWIPGLAGLILLSLGKRPA